ncbi:MAG: MFS transporter [Chloroflexota bacterium]|nr:MFS transporter [Dehalococcoidia bacterium]MDW8254546.1 MFS transporter [Chloroflexota bacterium]
MFYGWWIVIACGAILGTVIGFSFFAFGAFFAPLEAEFGWTRGQISSAVSLSFLAGGTLSFVVGRLVDRIGPRAVIACGGVVLGGALILFSLISQFWQLMAVLLLMSVGRVASTNPALNVTIATWFIRRRGLAFGLSRIGLSVGSLVAVPFTAAVITAFGWRTAVQVSAALTLAIVVPLAVLVLRRRPADLGLRPDGDPPAAPASGIAPAHGESTLGATFRDAVRTRAFWAIAIAMVCYFFGTDALNLHLVPFLTGRGMDYQAAAAVAGAIPATYMIGGLVGGALADRWSPRLVLAVAFAMTALSMAGLWAVGGSALIWVVVPIFGIAAGGVIAVHASFIADLFGLRAYGSILGAVFLVMTAGTVLGPMTAGLLFDHTGSYDLPFLLFVLMELVGGSVILLARPPRPALTPVAEAV